MAYDVFYKMGTDDNGRYWLELVATLETFNEVEDFLNKEKYENEYY